MTGTIELPRAKEPGSGLDDNWRVIVLNDNHNTFDGVAFALSSVLPGVGFDRGMDFANRIHSSGRAVVWYQSRRRVSTIAVASSANRAIEPTSSE